ncbi:MAG: transcriptional activator NhaR [Vicinamibacterales bacterium]|nr:transcriptional activator NhaR [Vicinamibacterales bacterium]
MEWLNYHHLLYFWVVAKEGSIARATEELGLAHPTISAQIHRLEEVLGERLFRREGRGLVLTDVGRVAFRYADEIFGLGREFLGAVKGRGAGRPIRLVVGITDVVPKVVAYQLIEPALGLSQPVQLICREDRSLEGFLGDLAVHNVDIVVADAPAGPGLAVRLQSYLLRECGTSFFGSRPLASSLRKRFPMSLDGAPFLLPGRDAVLRRSLERWFESQNVRPRIVAEIDDHALVKVLGQTGLGVFASPSIVDAEVRKHYDVQVIGRVDGLRQRFYVVSADRRLSHPAVVAICQAASKVPHASGRR